MPVDVIQLLKEAGLASEDAHSPDQNNFQYGWNFLMPENFNGTLLPIFLISPNTNGGKEIKLQHVPHLTQHNNSYLRYLSNYDKKLKTMTTIGEVGFDTHFRNRNRMRDDLIDHDKDDFSTFAHQLIDHFDKTRFAYCAYKRACYYADPETINLLTDIRQIAINIARHRSIGELHLLDISNYNEKLATLETTIKSLEKTARSSAHYGRLWNALHFFLATIKKIIPTNFLITKCNKANNKANTYDALKHTSTRSAQSMHLFQEKIGAKSIRAEVDTLLRNKKN